EIIEKIPETHEEAMSIVKKRDKISIGIIYKTLKPAFHEELYGDWNPVVNRFSREKRLDLIKNILQPK
ncbi:unnamed protein product, partial [marine sediment metagenome]